MKIKDDLSTYDVEGEHVTLFIAEDENAFHGILRSNRDAHFIMECLQENTTKEEILSKMQDTYEGDPKKMMADIDMVIENLRIADALEE